MSADRPVDICRYNFLKSIEDSEGKSVQATIKILMNSDCSSDLNPFLAIIVGLSRTLEGAQPNIGGGGIEHSQRDIKLRVSQSTVK